MRVFNPFSIFFARPCVFTSFFTGNFSQLNKIGFRRSLLASKRFFVKTWQWTALCWTKRAEQASGWDDTCYAFSNMYIQSALPYFLQHSIRLKLIPAMRSLLVRSWHQIWAHFSNFAAKKFTIFKLLFWLSWAVQLFQNICSFNCHL